jgi:hypothetical protein
MWRATEDCDAEKTGGVGGYVNKLEQLRQLVRAQHFLRLDVSVNRVQHDVQHTRHLPILMHVVQARHLQEGRKQGGVQMRGEG